MIFSLEILEKNNNECILILVIYWKKTGLLHTKISNHNIIYSSQKPRKLSSLPLKSSSWLFSLDAGMGIYHHHHHHRSVTELGHLLTHSGLTYPEVSSKVCHDSFCQLENTVSLPWVIYYEAFYLHVVGIYKFRINTYPRRIRCRSNLGHIFRGKKSASYGPGNMVVVF